jgi:hypothetical protein
MVRKVMDLSEAFPELSGHLDNLVALMYNGQTRLNPPVALNSRRLSVGAIAAVTALVHEWPKDEIGPIPANLNDEILNIVRMLVDDAAIPNVRDNPRYNGVLPSELELAKSNKISAIKAIRDRLGLSLLDAKHKIENALYYYQATA